jgi:hypothetical protein
MGDKPQPMRDLDQGKVKQGQQPGQRPPTDPFRK